MFNDFGFSNFNTMGGIYDPNTLGNIYGNAARFLNVTGSDDGTMGFLGPPLYGEDNSITWGGYPGGLQSVLGDPPEVPWGNPGGNSGGGVNWQSIINQGFGLGSQAIGAFGHHPTQQVGAGGSPVGGGYSPQAIKQANAQLQNSIGAQQRQLSGGGSSGGLGSSVGGGVDGIIGWATRNPIPVFLGIAGVFLLMKQPPGRR